jgi:hypothetical protein
MGWKISTIIIHKPVKIDNEALLRDLGLVKLTKIKDESFEDAMNPKGKKVYIGSYKNNLLICIPDLPLQLIENKETQFEKTLSQTFSDSEICSIVLHSTVNLWGYSIAINGKKIRARAGSAEDGTFLEFGEPLDEEKELLSKSQLDENGNKVYLFDDLPDELLSEDQVGENFVFSICKRYFEEELDCADELLYDTILSSYQYGKIVNNQSSLTNQIKDPKPWWKFW